MSIQVELGVPFPDVLQPGWGKTRAGGGIRAAELVGGQLVATARPRWLWQSPDGILMLRPSHLADDLETNASYSGQWMGLADFDHIPSRWLESVAPGGSQTKVVSLQRASLTDTSYNVAVIDAALSALDTADGDIQCALRSHSPLLANEAIGIRYLPAGTIETRTAALFAVAYGGLVHRLYGNGRLSVQRWADGAWRTELDAPLIQGELDPARPISLTIIPCGQDAVCVVGSGQPGGTEQRGRFGADDAPGVLVYRRPDAAYSAALGQYIKTTSSSLWIYLPRETAAPSLTIHRCRYSAADLMLEPDWLEEPRPSGTTAASQVVWQVGQTTGSGDGARIVRSATDLSPGARLLGPTGAAWDGEEYIAAAMRLVPNSGGAYSPEVWGVSYEVATRRRVPTTTGSDVTALVRDLEITFSDDPASDWCEFQLRADGFASQALAMPPTVRVRASGVTVFEGDAVRRQTVLTRPIGRMGADMMYTCESLWGRLERQRLGGFRALEGRTAAEIVAQGLARAGIAAADIVFVQPELLDWTIGGWGSPSDADAVEADQSVADLIRNIGSRFGYQGRGPLQIRRWNGLWQVYFHSPWDGSQPDLVIYNDTSAIPAMDDATRWAGDSDGVRWIRAKQPSVELDARQPEWNHLTCEVAIGSGPDAQVARVSIAPNPATVVSESDNAYIGGVRRQVMSGGPLAACRNEEELARAARTIYDREMREAITCTLTTEWQPYVLPGQLFELRIGNQSGGVWRIRRVAARFPRLDLPHLWEATLDAEWVGGVPDEDNTDLTPAFTWTKL